MSGDVSTVVNKVIEDPNDPFYVHPSDSIASSLISFKLLGAENFRVWRSSMTRSLKGRNKLGFADGSIKKPKDDESKILKWERANAVVCSWILNSVSDSIYSAHASTEDASVVWTELFETYHKADGSVVFNIHQQINSLTQGTLSVSEYFSKLDALWKEFDGLTNLVECSCEAAAKFNNHAKLMKLMQFLSGLDSSYNQVKSHILLMDPLPNVRTAFSIVSREESHQKNGSLSLGTGKGNGSQSSAFNVKLNEQKKGKTKTSNLQCKHRGLKGHTIERCYKLIGYPKDFKQRNGSLSQNKTFSGNNAVSKTNVVTSSESKDKSI